MARENRKRWLELDALRAFAVLLVVWSHSSNREIGIGGFDGVLLFFVISGFLITGILLQARVAAPWPFVLRAFYARRFLRIFPVYYALVFIAAGLGIPYVREALGWHLAYLSNWYYAFHGPLDKAMHLWSLAVEEQFYLFWPWFALLLPEAALRWALGIMIMTGPVSRLVLGSAGLNGTAVWTTTPAVLDALGLGCLLAYLWQYTESADRWARWAFFCGSVLIGCQAMASKLGLASHPVFTLAVSTLGWRLLCVWLVHRAARGAPGWLGRWLVTRPLIFVGTISYGIYLIHPFVMPTVLLIERRFNVHFPIPNYPGFGQFLSVALISIALASLSWRFFERPINSLKNRFPYVSNTRAIAEPSRPSTDNAHASPYSKTNSVNWL